MDNAASCWQRHLLVLTADCDLAHAKHRGRVTCVPLLTAREYLMEMKIPILRDDAVGKFIGELRKVLPSDGPNISDERLRQWPCEAAPSEIVSTLGLDGQGAEKARAALDSIRLASQTSATLDEAVKALIEAQADAPNPKKRENIVNAMVQALKMPYSHPPGDALFLSAIAPANDLGYFAYLRHLEQVAEDEIAIGPARTAAAYRRIAHLQDRYIHALVQRFALVFMSIGLPTTYEEMRDLHSETMGEICR
ncbi:hypothetical protein VA596_38210 [Amycolatopsis sp., V23-08]|uniref:DUF4935 domain-containing protein n=1 Tax=Amycolatopsis heterodermiae TaxID=3110235 RepID=A0ABU5RI42_9PSEU|nr:hypothetical protein [Amycolatopsis sp., V23-08]MEA5365414.1 hypothetical protein [Amycolatopsis sp., V23-08]